MALLTSRAGLDFVAAGAARSAFPVSATPTSPGFAAESQPRVSDTPSLPRNTHVSASLHRPLLLVRVGRAKPHTLELCKLQKLQYGP